MSLSTHREDSSGYRDSLGEGRESREGSRCGGDSGLSMELSSLSAASSQNSELARQVYEQSKMKGPGATLPKSESDEFSDLTSEMDFDELASERSRPDGGSSTDESGRDLLAASCVSSRKESKRQKHRPKSLNLSRSHSHTSSDEEEGPGSGGQEAGAAAASGKTSSSDVTSIGSGSSSSITLKNELGSKVRTTSGGENELSVAGSRGSEGLGAAGDSRGGKKGGGGGKDQHHLGSETMGKSLKEPTSLGSHDHLADGHAVNSPTPPRSPSWREGLESPPFSPRRRDSYPGKRRGSLSPKDKKTHFTYNDISPPSRQLSLDDLYGEASNSTHSALDNGIAGSQMPQRPSPMSPEEMKDSLVTTMGETLSFDMPNVRAKPPSSIPAPSATQPHHNDFQVTGSMPHSAPVMDLATYAATIANSTASLTSMSVSPTNLLPHTTSNSGGGLGEPMSPDSVESADSSSSPVSPGYYDNATPPSDDVEEVELADPASKSIDFQGSKRQKARPPSTDWSPVIDLSPILDVSPSVEEAEQEDMLAKQMEELERQRSREEAAAAYEDHDDDDHGVVAPPTAFFEPGKAFSPSQKKEIVDVIPRIPPPPSAKKLKQQLQEEQEEAEKEEDDNNGQTFTYSNTLRRCGNFEDISRLGSENSTIKTTADLSALDHVADDIDLHDAASEFPFLPCTSQAQMFPHSAPCISTSLSAFHAPSRHSDERQTEEQAATKLKDFEALITDEIHKIAEDMENIVKRGVSDLKPIPPPKPKRRLPDPELVLSPLSTKQQGVSEIPERKSVVIPSIKADDINDGSFSSKEGSFEDGNSGTTTTTASGKYLPRQDSTEKKKAKDLKAKPSPILIQHIEAEEQSVSPHYKVMESPPTPETKTIKREFSDSTSVSPSSSPDQDVYAFPSPVTPPDSDSSPPKPHSPSSPGTDFDEESSTRGGDDSARSPYGNNSMSPYRVGSPYDNAKPTAMPRSEHARASPLKGVQMAASQARQYDNGSTNGSSSQTCAESPPIVVRPPISPRKSIRKFDDAAKAAADSSPLYENVKDLTTQEYLEEQQKNAAALRGKSDAFSLPQQQTSIPKLDAPPSRDVLSSQFAGQPTEIFTYPVVGEFPARSRSSSAPPEELQALSEDAEAGASRPRSASVEHEGLETSMSVRDKIRAFEEPPVPRRRVSSLSSECVA
ncbi:uncharacterized protein LOC106014198 isoform X2 [Aplysia californica]|uniref:Uncharacterized protein LOC106014198 isoform X2 n=1 Tax=Aplysia californica TaxID=6500 RepID=A0ABM1AFU4_APLCA|nr:uncharacterized protein LOC106014198 isoform X2 [Aplysia californica]